ncbi:MAG: mannose-1-phosphate guanylyltransferase/mannose-6-phosphate isomerase [Komagataeibacter hansenii]|uniref:mannose-1-phosphate guanylyltransferase n=1 Tax=Komagataeibacter saccharivorans TaxID=265959 RepID=A0A347W9H5_9PROT|nr:mannose-1-phosphate guanylyltransferase/mannose-6-phosphate isomerase [Komagataeibacter saccharivorans]AXY21518.1 Mannose-1-phosphate guanylyltransferase 1 [Komagataeibacter saccharivorans]MBL7238277.1 mannose-1-phosphate guanylyltransferase/mannose-6-phosphate isomerase [Novacetimonas hansenii]
MPSSTTQLAEQHLPEPVVPVILSGGSGSRLWPVSRSSYPKQFWPLVSQHTMVQETALRSHGPGFAAPIVVCNNEHRFIMAEQLREVGVTGARILLEPMGRNSAPAIVAAALLAAETDPDAVLWVMAADAAMMKPENIRPALDLAVRVARAGRIVTFGMMPTKAETGYGYIEKGDSLPGYDGAFAVAQFTEKPDAARAAAMFESGRFLWNSGMFVFTARTLLQEMEKFEPAIVAAVGQAMAGRRTDIDFDRLDAEAFAASPEISIDYAVAERTDLMTVIPADFGWFDVGSWDALWEFNPKDRNGNVVSGDVVMNNTTNSYVRTDGILTAVAGVKDLLVVVNEDAVLVTHRDHAQDVKNIVAELKRTHRKEATAHRRCYRPWGFYESLIEGSRFQVKRIVVEPGQKLSLQKHFHRAEHWVVVEGTAQVVRNEETILVRENESVYLPLGAVHRLENPGRIPLTLIEVQSGPYLGEDDIVRLEDVYSRS